MFGPVIKFFYGWYIDDTINFYNWFIGLLKTMDRDVGFVGNVQNWTSPLYGDYSYIGIVAGPVFRTFRILFGLTLYLVIAAICLAVYLFWIILPIMVIVMMFLNLLVLIKALEPVLALEDGVLKIFIQ